MDYREYLDKLVEAATAFAENVGEVTRQKADEAKAAVKIKKLEMDLDKAYRSLGRIMYQIEKGILTRDDQIVEAACRQVELIEEEIKELGKVAEKGENKPCDCHKEETCECAKEEPCECPGEENCECHKEEGCCETEEKPACACERKIEIEIIHPDKPEE